MTAPRVPDDVPCKRHPDRMFPDPRNAEAVEAARHTCESGYSGKPCPFFDECLAYALQHDVEGVWAGTDEAERAGIRRRHGIEAERTNRGRGTRGWGLEPHGTNARARQERREGKKPCGPCADAEHRYKYPKNPSRRRVS